MGTLESNETDKALRGKMRAERLDRPDWFYKIYNENGEFVSSTSMSKGSKNIHYEQIELVIWHTNLVSVRPNNLLIS